MQDAEVSQARRPFDTRISLSENPGGLEIVIPPMRLGLRHVAALLFIGFLLVIPWAVTAHGNAPLVFALPFWVVGVGVTYALLLSLVQTTHITVGPQTTVLDRSPLGSRRSLATAEIGVRVGRQSRTDDDRPGPRSLLLEYGTRTYYLMSGYSDQEQRWVADQMREWLGRVQRA